MSIGTKIALTAVGFGVIFSALAGEITGIVWATLAGYWVWKHAQLQQDYDDLRTEHVSRPGEYRVTVRTDTFERFLEVINHLPPPPSPDHYSVGGTNPHMCVCGKPIADHEPHGG